MVDREARSGGVPEGDEVGGSPSGSDTAATPAPDAAPLVHPAAEPTPDEVDLGRRRFFRQFASDAIQTAATVVGAASAFQRSSAEAASAILDPAGTAARVESRRGLPSPGGGPGRPLAPSLVDPATGTAAPPPDAIFRTAFRLDERSLILVDQRALPDAVLEYRCTAAVEVAEAIRDRVVRGGPAVAQAAAIGFAITAERLADTSSYGRRAGLRGSANALANADPGSFTLRRAVDRMVARWEAFGELTEDGAGLAAALRGEALAIVAEATDAHGLIADAALAELPSTVEGPLRILTLGSTGALAGGQFGTALGVVSAAASAGRDVRVVLCETRPSLDGARIAAWELGNLGVPYALVADAAAPGRIAAGAIDVVLVAADRVVANGDVVGAVGTYPLAAVAARHGIPVIVCAPLATVDVATPDGERVKLAERAGTELTSFGGRNVAPADARAVNVLEDVTPAALVSAIVTEAGVLRPPFGPALAGAVPAPGAPTAHAATDAPSAPDAPTAPTPAGSA